LLKFVKRQLRQRYPDLVVAYHTYRQSRAMYRHRLQVTPYGFRFMGHLAMQDGSFEHEEAELIQRYLEHISVFVDVGANIGFFACLARHLGKHVVAVEPLTQNLEFLYANLNANGWTDIEVFPVGLGDHAGLGMLYGGGTGASLVSQWAGASDVWRRTIPISTLDILLGERFSGHKMMIKVDAEGAEYPVLQGAAKTLDRSPSPIWLVEVCLTEHHPAGINPHFQDVFRTFWARGYEARAVDERNKMVRPEDVERWVRKRRRDFGFINYIFERTIR